MDRRPVWNAPVKVVLSAIAFFLLGGLSDFWLREQSAGLSVALIHDAFIGSGAGLLVLLYERRSRESIRKKLEVIRLMNHHVRNSLQVISYAVSDPKRAEHEAQLRNAVERIEWALREVLPGKAKDIKSLLLPPQN